VTVPAAGGCYSARVRGLSRVLWVVMVASLAACGDDGPTNRPPEDDATSSPTFPFTTTLSTSLSSGDTQDSDETGSDTDTDDEGVTTSSTGAGEFCPATHRCVAEVPEGWEGPGTALTAESAAARPACEGPYAEPGAMGFEGLVAPEATCGCECNEPTGSECDNSATVRYWGASDTCDEGASTQVTVFAGVCTNLPSSFPGGNNWQIDLVAATGGTCSREELEVVEDAAWAQQVVTCGGAEQIGGCASGRTCTPQPEAEDVPICVWRIGEHECPDGWDDARMIYTNVNDTRDCAPCTCSEPMGLCDDVRITMTENFNCNVPIANTFEADGECHAGSGIAVRAAAMATGEANAFCNPSDPMPVGEAIGADPITLCCD
jgi:predicted small lipoprotein YifL